MERWCWALAIGFFVARPSPALAWGTDEHITLCEDIELPPAMAGVTVAGYTIPEWCALPDFEHAISNVVTAGPCSGFDTAHWRAAIEGCTDIWARNNNHFGGFAYSSWHYYHQMALDAARAFASRCTPGCDAAAFAIEGWALHYLTDIFAAGHAWNPLGDYETPEGNYYMYYGSSDHLPDLVFPPPGGINVFRQDLHDWLNDATLRVVPGVQFAEGRFGINVVGDDQLGPGIQKSWTLARARASVMEVWWTMLGVAGTGGCTLTGVCTPDSARPYLDQGTSYQCVPYLSNQSYEQAMNALGADSDTDTYYERCGFLPPQGRDCAYKGPDRPIPWWPGSLHFDRDMGNPAALLGCDLGDATVYDSGACVDMIYGASEIETMICGTLPAGSCTFTDDCVVPFEPGGSTGGEDAGTGGGDGGTSGGTDAGTGGGTDAGTAGSPDGATAGGRDREGGGCSGGCAVTDPDATTSCLPLALVLGVLLRRRRRIG